MNDISLDTLQTELGFVGESGAFVQLLESIRQVAPTNITVLIEGDSGTGMAGSVHRHGHLEALGQESRWCASWA